MAKCISFLISEKGHTFEKEDIQVNLLYNFPRENPDVWKMANSFSAKGLQPEKFMGEGSTGKYLLSQKRTSLFFNSKQAALNEKHYVRNDTDDKDGKNEIKGSICCYLEDFGNVDGIYVRSILFISTTQKKIVNEKRFRDKYKEIEAEKKIKDACITLSDNIKNYILVNYNNRLGIELCNYYVQYLHQKSGKYKAKKKRKTEEKD